jgi:secreted trypsin-like serine protease
MLSIVVVILVGLFSAALGQDTYKCNVTATCGCSPANPTTVLNRIVGGENARAGSWPWVVSLRDRGSHYCGGSIIDSRFILTSAFCADGWDNLSNFTILAGAVTIEGSESTARVLKVDRIILHPSYDSKTKTYDIALIRLATRLDLSGNTLKPICIPKGGGLLPPTNDRSLVAIGWGDLSENIQQYSPILQQVTVFSVNPRDSASCRNITSNIKLQFCAGLSAGGKGSFVLLFLQI